MGKAWISDIDGSYNQFSDREVKQNIAKVPDVLDRVRQLRPVTYQYRAAADGRRQSWGFIAQEVEPLFPDFVSEKQGIKGLAYDNFAVVSIKAIQELSQLIERQESEIESLKSDMEDVLAKMEQILAQHTTTPTVNQYALKMDQRAQLAQNRPNPFREQTVIDFFVPDDVQSAYLRITDASGQVLQQVSLDKRGVSQLTIAANTYPAGTYYYALILDGVVFGTRAMVLTK